MEDFSAKIESIKTNKGIRYTATIQYIGNDDSLHDFLAKKRKDSIAYVKLLISPLKRYDYTILGKYSYNEPHDGMLQSFYNYASMYNMYEEFPVTKKLKGASYALFMSCICDAIKTGYLKPESKILLEASGTIEGLEREESYKALVRHYESLGFKQIFPQLYEKGIEYELIPMIGEIRNIVKNCGFKVSDEMKQVLPIKLCMDICM